MFRTLCVAMLLVPCGTGVLRAADLSSEERDKQNEFKKAYNDRTQPDHLKALALLDGLQHPSTWDLLIQVARNDPAKDVRLAAFKRLCPMPARTPKLAETLASVFEDVKFNDSEMRCAYGAEMANSEFKYSLFEALADYGSKLRYPDLVTNLGGQNQRQGGGISVSSDPNTMLRRQRGEFEKFVEVFNKLTGANITAHDKTSPATVRKWWEENKAKFIAADREKATKFAVEDSFNRPKDNPLLPKAAQKKTDTADKPDKADKANKADKADKVE